MQHRITSCLLDSFANPGLLHFGRRGEETAACLLCPGECRIKEEPQVRSPKRAKADALGKLAKLVQGVAPPVHQYLVVDIVEMRCRGNLDDGYAARFENTVKLAY